MKRPPSCIILVVSLGLSLFCACRTQASRAEPAPSPRPVGALVGKTPAGASEPDAEGPEKTPAGEILPDGERLVLTFAGDIMAHTVNFSMNGYDRIYSDVRSLLASDDLSFANFESPVDDRRPFSTYPLFNAHASYLEAACEAGFDVFSLANNHANDQGSEGVRETRRAASDQSLKRDVFFSGLREKQGEPLRPIVIRKKGWTVLFIAVTEILNANDEAGKLVNYVPATEQNRAKFIADLEKMRRDNPCDIFILSVHSGESEYVRVVSPEKKKWFQAIAAAGVDIVWAHHPHVMQTWEKGLVGARNVLYLYSMGNFVSGQRFAPDLANPEGSREYTGDAVLLSVTLSGKVGPGGNGKPGIDLSAIPIPVTNWNDPHGGIVVRRFTPQFIESLPASLRSYYHKRFALLGAYLPLLPDEEGTAILSE